MPLKRHLRLVVYVLCAAFAVLVIVDAGRDWWAYHKLYVLWHEQSEPMPEVHPGQPIHPGSNQVIHTVNSSNIPSYVNGLGTFQASYQVETDGTGIEPNSFLHVDILATPSDFDVVPTSNEDAYVGRGSEALLVFLVTPKRNGFLSMAVRWSIYSVNPKTKKRTVESKATEFPQILVDEPFLTVPWFEAHAFARDLLFLLLPFVIGFIAGRLTDTPKL